MPPQVLFAWLRSLCVFVFLRYRRRLRLICRMIDGLILNHRWLLILRFLSHCFTPFLKDATLKGVYFEDLENQFAEDSAIPVIIGHTTWKRLINLESVPCIGFTCCTELIPKCQTRLWPSFAPILRNKCSMCINREVGSIAIGHVGR